MTKRNNENTLKLLEEYYKSAKEQKDAWDFFLNTAEYVRFVQQNSNFAEAIRQLEEQQKRAYEIFHKIDNRAIKELENATKTITETIKRLNINLEPVNNVIKELEGYYAGLILSSVSKAHKLDTYLFDIARHLKASGFENIIQQFVDEQKKIKNIYGNFTFSQTLPLRDEAERELGMKRETEIWGAWEIFPFISRIFFDEVNLEKELVEAKNQNDKMAKWTLMNYIGVRTELGTMRAHKKSDSELVFFRVSDFKNKLDRIHKYLITELLSGDEEQQRLDFDDKRSILYFLGEKITIAKRAENDAHELLRVIFQNRHKIWNNDEILDKWLFNRIKPNTPKNKVYQAGKAVNRIVAQETTIKNFLDISTKTVAINKKYLNSKSL